MYEKKINNEIWIAVKYPQTGRTALFADVASTGTKALRLFFYWSLVSFDRTSFLFIDEFDAFFHFQSAASIVSQLNKSKFQVALTSHNTYLMQNEFTRPDCCFLMSKSAIKSLPDCTDREIRQAHNLEKMYVNDAFTV
jgi:AAA15 family ATPase/GTPase